MGILYIENQQKNLKEVKTKINGKQIHIYGPAGNLIKMAVFPSRWRFSAVFFFFFK